MFAQAARMKAFHIAVGNKEDASERAFGGILFSHQMGHLRSAVRSPN